MGKFLAKHYVALRIENMSSYNIPAIWNWRWV